MAFLFGILWNIGLAVLIGVDPHPRLDLNRCWFDATNRVKYCWPKDGCFWTDGQSALCWRVETVHASRR